MTHFVDICREEKLCIRLRFFIGFGWMTKIIVFDVSYVKDNDYWRDNIENIKYIYFGFYDVKNYYFWNAVKKPNKKIISDNPNAKIDNPHLEVMDVASLCAPLAIGRHTDRDGDRKPVPIVVKIEGEERGKEGRTAPGATATAPKQPAGLAGDACSKCGPQSSCKTTRCGCRWAGRNCVSCWCLVRCANVAPQTWQEKQQTLR